MIAENIQDGTKQRTLHSVQCCVEQLLQVTTSYTLHDGTDLTLRRKFDICGIADDHLLVRIQFDEGIKVNEEASVHRLVIAGGNAHVTVVAQTCYIFSFFVKNSVSP